MKYRVSDMPQSCFERARKSSERMGFCGSLMSMKPMKMKIELDPYLIKNRIIEYLDPPLVKNNLEAVSYTHLDVYKRQEHLPCRAALKRLSF